jgi:hypothetical protein
MPANNPVLAAATPSLRIGFAAHGSVVGPQYRIIVANGFGCVVHSQA